jgi:hypothetical protein
LSPPRSIVLLVGSPKGKGGTSGSIGEYILSKLPDEGVSKETYHVGKTIRKADKWSKVMTAVDSADTIILSFPLYWDHLPSHLIRALESLHAHRQEAPPVKPQKLVVVVNNGFPEPWHNEVALRICQRFAKDASFEWGGALNVGGGAAIDGRPMEQSGGMTIKLRGALDEATVAIGKGVPVPAEVEARVAQQLYPAWINILFGGFGWWYQKRKKGGKGSLRVKPYEE